MTEQPKATTRPLADVIAEESAANPEFAAGVEAARAHHRHECACNRNWGGTCGPCECGR